MNFSKKTALATVLLLSTASAFAADKSTLTMTGKVLPSGCDIDFTTNGGLIEYTIDPAALNRDVETGLEPKDMGYSIRCGAPIKIAASWSDFRADSSRGDYDFGLGKHEGANIGFYEIVSKGTARGDGDSLRPIAKEGNMEDGGWNILDENNSLLHPNVRYMSFALNGAPTIDPVARKTYEGTFMVKTVINPTSTLNMTSQIALDGQSTITLNYP